MATWEQFHALYEAMAGINVGSFAFPRLSRPFLRAEERRGRALRDSIASDHRQHDEITDGARGFTREQRELEATIDRVRGFCLTVGVFAIGMLCVATARADIAADPAAAWGPVVVMATPAVVMFGLNRKARCKLGNLAKLRRQLERSALQ